MRFRCGLPENQARLTLQHLYNHHSESRFSPRHDIDTMATFICENRQSKTKISPVWHGSVVNSESTLHQLSPYIGKMKSSMAAALISTFTKKGDVVFDPFAGSGTIPLEAWIAGRKAIAKDLNPYAIVLTTAKLFPYESLAEGLSDISLLSPRAVHCMKSVDLRRIPKWVRSFFNAETLREIVGWTQVLKKSERSFLLACLLGILHHQRPGFLSYPSSHTVPYLRSKKFPLAEFPHMYEYREVRTRLEAKVIRALSRVPKLDFGITRISSDHRTLRLQDQKVDAIITSPPYMRSLDYARDNRLRLWFLRCKNWERIERKVSPNEESFISLMRKSFIQWKNLLAPRGYCVIVAGDAFCPTYRAPMPEALTEMVTSEIGGFELADVFRDAIPDVRRVRRGLSGNLQETVLVFKRK